MSLLSTSGPPRGLDRAVQARASWSRARRSSPAYAAAFIVAALALGALLIYAVPKLVEVGGGTDPGPPVTGCVGWFLLQLPPFCHPPQLTPSHTAASLCLTNRSSRHSMANWSSGSRSHSSRCRAAPALNATPGSTQRWTCGSPRPGPLPTPAPRAQKRLCRRCATPCGTSEPQRGPLGEEGCGGSVIWQAEVLWASEQNAEVG